MKTLIIYDNKGDVVYTRSGSGDELSNITPIIANIPEGMYISGIDRENNVPILTEIPPDRLDVLQKQIDDAILEMTMLISMGVGF